MRLYIGRKKIKRKPFFAVVVTAVCLTAHFLLKRAEPVFVAQTSNYSNTAFTDLVNKCIIRSVDEGGFDEFLKVDSQSGITSMQTDTALINSTVSKLVIDIQNALNSDYPAKVYIPLGSLSRYHILSSTGPQIEVKIIPISVVNSSYDETFEAVGINQIRHCINLKISVDMLYKGYLMTETERIETTVPLIDNIISGDVPEYYGSGVISS